MRINSTKFNSLLAEAGATQAALARAMKWSEARLSYQLSKARAREHVKPSVIGALCAAFSAILNRPVELDEFVLAADLPRQTAGK